MLCQRVARVGALQPASIASVWQRLRLTSTASRNICTGSGPSTAVLVSAARTPIGSFGHAGSLSSLSAVELGSVALEACLKKAVGDDDDKRRQQQLRDEIQELFMGNVISACLGQAPARQAGCGAGRHVLDWNVPCTTLNKVCASGTKAVMLAALSVMCGMKDAVLAGGMESMSNAPYALQRGRQGLGFGHTKFEDLIIKDGLWDAFDDHHMGSAAEICASKYGISRADQDAYATTSYERAQAAVKAGRFEQEMAPVTTGKGEVVTCDQEPFKVKFDKISQLRPAFKKGGTVTAANASSLNDGAAAVLVTSAAFAERHGLHPLARVLAMADAAKPPVEFTTAPSLAIRLALHRAGLSISDVDLWEINEAFSVVSLVNNQLLGIDADRVNVNGGAVALGHPIGASGCRILVTLLYELQRRQQQVGVAAICNGGGGASAIVVERFA